MWAAILLVLSELFWHVPTAGETAAERYVRHETIALSIEAAVDKATCRNVAACIPVWVGDPLELTAAVLWTGFSESAFALRIHADECRVAIGECDYGLSKSPWQLKATRTFPEREWRLLAGVGLEPTSRAAWEATQRLLRAYRLCTKRGLRGWAHAFSLYGTGRRCDLASLGQRAARLPRLTERLRANQLALRPPSG